MNKTTFPPEHPEERSYTYFPGFLVKDSPTGKDIPPHILAEWTDEQGRINKDIAHEYSSSPPDELILADIKFLKQWDRTGF